MRNKITVFAASSSAKSINKQFAHWVAKLVEKAEINLLDLNDYEMPIYSIDKEKANGIPPQAHHFRAQLNTADAFIISFAEHNGAFTAAYKNIYDWVSRIEMDVWKNKPMFLLSTSPGSRGASGVLNAALTHIRFSNKNQISHFSLPKFNTHFSKENGIVDMGLRKSFTEQMISFVNAL